MGTTYGKWKLQHLDHFSPGWWPCMLVMGQKVHGDPNRIRWYNPETGEAQYKPIVNSCIAPPKDDQ